MSVLFLQGVCSQNAGVAKITTIANLKPKQGRQRHTSTLSFITRASLPLLAIQSTTLWWVDKRTIVQFEKEPSEMGKGSFQYA